MLHPARFRKILCEFPLADSDRFSGLVKYDGSGTAGALVESYDELFHKNIMFMQS